MPGARCQGAIMIAAGESLEFSVMTRVGNFCDHGVLGIEIVGCLTDQLDSRGVNFSGIRSGKFIQILCLLVVHLWSPRGYTNVFKSETGAVVDESIKRDSVAI